MATINAQSISVGRPLATLESRSSMAAAFAALVVAVLSAMVLTGWLTETEALTNPRPGQITVKANIAIGFLALAVALMAAASTRRRMVSRIQLVAAAAAIAIGILTLIEWAGARIDIGSLVTPGVWATNDAVAGRPAITTCFAMVILGIASLPIFDQHPRSSVRAGVSLVAVGIASAVMLARGMSSAWPLAGSGLDGASVIAQVAIMITAFGLLVLSYSPMLRLLRRPGPIGMTARAGLVVSVMVPVALAAVGNYSISRGLVEPTAAVTFIASLGIVVGILSTMLTASRSAQFQDNLDAARADLKTSEARALAVLDQLPDMVITKDRDGTVTWVNDAVEKTLHVTRDGVVGTSGEGLLPASAYATIVAQERRTLDTGAATIGSAVLDPNTRQKRWLDVRILPLQGANGAAGGVLEVLTDVTGTRAAQVAADRLAAVVTSSDEGIFSIDLDGIVTSWNQAAERIFGFSAEEVIGTSASGILSVDAAGRTGTRDAEGGHADGELHDEWLTREGRHINLRMSAAPLRDHYGVRVGTSIIASDMTLAVAAKRDLERSEASLRRATHDLARSNESLQEFASVASHDLKEPLRKIRAFGDRLQRREGAALSEEGSADLGRMMDAAERMQTLISDLLALARVSSAQRILTPVAMAAVVADALDDLAERVVASGADIEVGDLPVVIVDAAQMRRVFMNVIGNALKFTKPGAAPQIRIGVDEPAGGGDDDTSIAMYVEDHGVGFEQRHAERIFNPFERLHGRDEFEGTGMGLAICRQIVEGHGGTIEASSELGVGTRMNITLPKQALLPEPAGAPS